MKKALPGALSASLVLTLALAACSDAPRSEGSEDAKELATPLTVPVPTLNQFVVLSRVGATFGQRCIVTGGDIGVAANNGGALNTLTGGNDARLGVGEVLLAPGVVLGARTATGEIGADQINAPPSAMTGPRSAFVPPPAAPTPGAVNPGATAVNVNAGQTSTLNAGRYGVVTVSGTLNLAGGSYDVRSVRLNPDARLVAQADATLRIASTLTLADRARVSTAPALGPRNLRLVVAGRDENDNSVTLGADARLGGLVVAERTLRGADRAILAGSIAARNVVLGNDARLAFDGGFECSTNAGCDDGNACTQDSCVDSKCAHAATPLVCQASDACHDAGSCDPATGACSNPAKLDGSACDDGDQCTGGDSCQAGSCTGGTQVQCVALDACHVAGSCDPGTGVCSDPPAPDGLPCDDQNACSLGDHCVLGSCQAGTDYAITEFATGLTRPRSIVAGPASELWFVSPESALGVSDGSIASITTAGVVTRHAASRELGAMLLGGDGKLWLAERLLGLPALGCFDTESRSFVADFSGDVPYDLVASNDGGEPLIWFTSGSSVGRMRPSGERLTAVPTFYVARAITAAAPSPKTLIWFSEANGGGFAMLGRLDYPNLKQFSVTTPGELSDLVEGPDGAIWFTDPTQNEVGRMPAAGGTPQKYALPSPSSAPHSIATGPDGNLWVTLRGANKLAMITPEGVVMEVCIPTAQSEPGQLAVGSDGNVWFTESASGKVGRVRLAP